MKKSLLALALVFIIISFSCQKKNDMQAGTTTQSGDCKSCSYFPTCNGSVYVYRDSSQSGIKLNTDTLKFLKDTIIDNKKFEKFSYSSRPKAPSYINCTNGAIRTISYANVSASGNTISKIDLTVLKANAVVGTTWTDTISTGGGQSAIYDFILEEKGMSRTVNGKNFNDVILVSFEITAYSPIFGNFPAGYVEYYYAKGVGLIEAVLMDNSMNIYQHQTIKSYFIP